MTMVEPNERTLTEGTHVEIRNRFDRRWTRGFVVVEVVDGGYRVRRASDTEVLPHVFAPEEVRKELGRGQWWY